MSRNNDWYRKSLIFCMLNCLDDILRTDGKSARLCQKTGKGKRNISAYRIVGDGIVLMIYVRTNGPVGKTIWRGKFNPGPRINSTSAYVVFVVISIPVKKSVTKVSIFRVSCVIFPMGVWYFLGRHFSYAQLNSGCVFVLGSICWLYYRYVARVINILCMQC